MFDKRYRIGIIGDGCFLESAIKAWLGSGLLDSLVICDRSVAASPPPVNGAEYYRDEFELLAAAGIDVLELACSAGVSRAVLEAAVKIGLPIAVSGALADSYPAALSVSSAISATRAPFMHMDSFGEHPFIERALKEIRRESIGEVQMLRVKANAGNTGAGGGTEGGNPLLRREFDRTLMIEKLFGPVTEVFCQAGRDSWLVSYRFAETGRYGLLEAVFSPELRFNPDLPPIDDQVEITGTDGIIWLRNLSGLLIEAPRFAMKRRDEMLVLDDRIEYSLESRELDLRLRLIESVEKKSAAPFDAAPYLRAARLAEAARISSSENRPVRPEEVSPYQK